MEHKDNNSIFSDNDLEIISSQDYIIRKNALIQSVNDTLLDLERRVSSTEIQNIIPEVLKDRRGKISKGENYHGMPWMVLDAPALFENRSILAFRHIFIWGHPFSFNLHVSGMFMDYLDMSKQNELKSRNWSFLIGEDAFINHFDPELFKPMSEFSPTIINKQGYLRLNKMIPLKESSSFTNQCIGFIKDVSDLGLIKNR
jgi:hypothetical protein